MYFFLAFSMCWSEFTCDNACTFGTSSKSSSTSTKTMASLDSPWKAQSWSEAITTGLLPCASKAAATAIKPWTCWLRHYHTPSINNTRNGFEGEGSVRVRSGKCNTSTTSARTDTDTRHFNIALQSHLPSHQRALPPPYNASTCRTVGQPQLMYLWYQSVLYYVEQWILLPSRVLSIPILRVSMYSISGLESSMLQSTGPHPNKWCGSSRVREIHFKFCRFCHADCHSWSVCAPAWSDRPWQCRDRRDYRNGGIVPEVVRTFYRSMYIIRHMIARRRPSPHSLALSG